MSEPTPKKSRLPVPSAINVSQEGMSSAQLGSLLKALPPNNSIIHYEIMTPCVWKSWDLAITMFGLKMVTVLMAL